MASFAKGNLLSCCPVLDTLMEYDFFSLSPGMYLFFSYRLDLLEMLEKVCCCFYRDNVHPFIINMLHPSQCGDSLFNGTSGCSISLQNWDDSFQRCAEDEC